MVLCKVELLLLPPGSYFALAANVREAGCTRGFPGPWPRSDLGRPQRGAAARGFGYMFENAFNTAFKRVMGRPPRQYVNERSNGGSDPVSTAVDLHRSFQ